MRARKLLVIVALMLCPANRGQAQSIDEVYKKALTEGGTLNFYGTLAQINAEIILPAFEKRFPGIKVNHVDATADQLAARVIAEARGGRGCLRIFFKRCWTVWFTSKTKVCFSINSILKQTPIPKNLKERAGSPAI